MALATISALGSVGVEATATANLAFTLVTTTVGKLVVVFAVSRSATVSYTALSSTNVSVWDNVGSFSFAVNGSVPAQTITVFAGQVTTAASATVTATPSASMASIAGGFSWREVTTSALSAFTSWVVEATGSLTNTSSSTALTLPTLVPLGSNRAYIGYCDPVGTFDTTGQTAGYALANESSGMGNQWITNLSVSTSQSPAGKQTSAGVSDTVGILVRAYEADTSVGTILNIGSGSGQNHFKLQTAFNNYAAPEEISQAQIAGGWNTDPQFVATVNGTVQFSVQAGAPSTSGGSQATIYARSELREMNTDGTTEMAFNALSGVHWIRGRTKVTSLPAGSGSPPRQRSTLCQLHDGVTNIGEVLKYYLQENSGTGLVELRLSVWDSGNGMPRYNLNYAVNDVFDWAIKVDNTISSGWWGVYFQDLGTPVYTSLDYIADGFSNVFSGLSEYYFKCGSYPTVNETQGVDPAALSTVELSYVQHWHTGWPTPSPAVSLPKTFQFAPSFG